MQEMTKEEFDLLKRLIVQQLDEAIEAGSEEERLGRIKKLKEIILNK